MCLRLTDAISRTRTVEEIYEIALDMLGEGLGVSRAAILLFDPDGVMRFKAWRGLSDAYRSAVDGHAPWTPRTTDAEPIVVADIEREPSLAPYLSTIQTEGIAAMAFIPLRSLGRVIGKFMVYGDVPRRLTASELQLALLVASHVAFAVERMRAEHLARRSEERLRFALDAASMGTWDWVSRARDRGERVCEARGPGARAGSGLRRLLPEAGRRGCVRTRRSRRLVGRRLTVSVSLSRWRR